MQVDCHSRPELLGEFHIPIRRRLRITSTSESTIIPPSIIDSSASIAGQFDRNELHLLGIFRVFPFRDILADSAEGNLLGRAFRMPDACAFAGAVSDFRNHGGHRYDAGRKYGPAEEVVQKAALSCFEPSKDGNGDLFLRDYRPGGGEQAR